MTDLLREIVEFVRAIPGHLGLEGWWAEVASTVVTAAVVWIGYSYLPPSRRLPDIPSVQRVKLAAKNRLTRDRPAPATRFRFLLTWLERDKGEFARIVDEALGHVDGIELVYSARVVKASGAGEDRRPRIVEKARKLLLSRSADVAIVGSVSSKDALHLWFVPRGSEGSLRRDRPYELWRSTLKKDFREDLNEQLVETALKAAAPFVDSDARAATLAAELKRSVTRIEHLLEIQQITDPARRARLHAARGDALVTWGTMESGTEPFDQAVDVLSTALKMFTRAVRARNWTKANEKLVEAFYPLVVLQEEKVGSRYIV